MKKFSALRELVPKKWMVWVCEPNEVHYLIKTRNSYKWSTVQNMRDCSDVICFDSKKEAKAFMKSCVMKNKLPVSKDFRIDYDLVVPTFEDDKLWYESVKSVGRF